MKKHTILLWALPIMILGLAFVICLIAALGSDWVRFPLAFPEVKTFYQGFTNIFVGILQFTIGIIMIVIPFVIISKVYRW